MSPARGEQHLSACRGAPEGTWARKLPSLCSGAGGFCLSLVLARRERLRKVMLAASQKSSARPWEEGSGLPSFSSGCTAGFFSLGIRGARQPCLGRARSVPRRAEAALEGAGVGASAVQGSAGGPGTPRPSTCFPRPSAAFPGLAAGGRGEGGSAAGQRVLFQRWEGRERRRLGRTSAVLPCR